MAIKFDTSSYTFNDLSNKYGSFFAPTCAILVEGESLTLDTVPIGSLQVQSSTESKADSFQFRIDNAYDPETREFQWIGSKIDVGKTIVIKLGYKDRLEEVFDGYVTGLSFDYSPDGQPAVVVRGMDRSMFLMRSVNSKVWHEKKVSDVVKEIAAAHSLTSAVDDTTTVKPTIEQMRTSDFLFLKQLAKDVNHEFFIVGSKLIFRKLNPSSSPVMTLTYGKDLIGFSVDVDISAQIGKAVVHALNPKTNEAMQATSQSVNKIGSNAKTGKDIVSALSSRAVEHVYTVTSTAAEVQTMANAVLNEKAMDLVTGEGQSIGIPELRAGRFIKLAGLGKRFNQPFVMKEVTHTLDDRGYRTAFKVGGNAI